jgi:serine/threonine protein kinase
VKVAEGKCSWEMESLVERMLDKDPSTRITASGILGHESMRKRKGKFL